MRDVAQGAVVAAELAREVGDLTAQAAIGVVDADETNHRGHGMTLTAIGPIGSRVRATRTSP
jgi:hypothetical protein